MRIATILLIAFALLCMAACAYAMRGMGMRRSPEQEPEQDINSDRKTARRGRAKVSNRIAFV